MKLSVIIPCYRENPAPAIESIKNQLYYDSCDVEIIVSLDDPERTLEYPDVTVISTTENTGPGLARQRGLDVATGEYVTFLDADDIWYNALGYALFLRDVYWQGGAVVDIVKFGILEQLTSGDFNLISDDSTWCFGKLYRKEFLLENNIRFHPDFRVHEDSFFIRLAELCNPIAITHSDAVYLWVSNPRSIVRRNGGEYWQTSFPEYIKVLMLLRDERIRRKIAYDGAYDLAYCYAVISRMDQKYIDPCMQLLSGWGSSPAAMQKDRLCQYLCEIEGRSSLPQRVPRFTLKDFLEEIK